MRKYVELAMLLAVSIVFGILESFIPTFVVGAKLGLANIVVILAMYIYSFKEAIVLLITRILLVSLLLGTFLSPVFYMSLSGGICAIIIMCILKRCKFHVVCVSIGGALMHGVGQILIAMIIISPASIYYFPLMGLVSILTGVLTGVIAMRLIKIRNNYELKG